MINKIKQSLMTISAALLLAVPVLVPVTVSAQEADIEGGLCAGANFTTDTSSTCDEDPVAQDKVNSLITTIINIFSLVVGFVSVVMIIIGGLKYVTSGGDSSNVTSAKNTILYAIIGLVIVALSQFIVRFVLSRVS